MTKTAPKHNKKEEQKKLAVRIICIALVVVMAVTSLLAMFPALLQGNDDTVVYTMDDLIAMGWVQVDEDGNYIFVGDGTVTPETDDGHNHD